MIQCICQFNLKRFLDVLQPNLQKVQLRRVRSPQGRRESGRSPSLGSDSDSEEIRSEDPHQVGGRKTDRLTSRDRQRRSGLS